MRGPDRQTIAFGLASGVAAVGTLALGADAALPSYAGGLAMSLAALVAGGRAPLPLAFWLGAGTTAWLLGRAALTGGLWLAGPELAAMAGIAGAFAVGVQAGAETQRARRAASLLTATLAGLAVLAFAAHVASPDAVLGRPKPYHQGRLTGTFLSANTAATVCGLGLALGLAGLARAVRGAGGVLRGLEAAGRRGLAPGVLTLFSATCLLLTGSRAGLLAGAFGALVVLAPRRARGVRLPALLGAVAACALLLAASGGVLGDRLADVGAGASGRGALWSASLEAWREAPWLGHGLGSFPRALAPHVTAWTAPVLSVQGAAHDLPLQWLVQAGVVGTSMGAATLAALGRTLASGLARRRRGRWILRAGLGGLAVFGLHGLVDYALEVPAASWWLALLTGLAAGVAGGGTPAGERRAAPR